MKSAVPYLFLPQEALLPIFISLAGLLMVVGFRKAAGSLIVFALGSALFLPMLEPIIESLIYALPGWAVMLILVAIALKLLRALAALFLGTNAADQMVGTLAADVVRFLLLLPFRGLKWFVQWLIVRR